MVRRRSTSGRLPASQRSPAPPPTAGAAGVVGDSVDRIMAEWAGEWPDLAVDPIKVITRLTRVLTRLDEDMADLFARHDLSAADFTMLAALRRAGAPYTLPQNALMERLRLTSGTVSVRLARLEGKGVVARGPSNKDARGVLVTLTTEGAELFDRVAPEHLANEDVLLSALTPSQRAELADLLRILLVGFENDRATHPSGFVVEAAHLARRARAAVGLTDRSGLLVVHVEPGGPAQGAGLRTGDLLLEAGDRRTVSCLALTAATEAARHGDATLVLRILRGEHEHLVHLPAPASLVRPPA